MQEKRSKKKRKIVPRGDEHYCAAYMLAREQGVKNTRVGPANRRCLVEKQRGYEREREILARSHQKSMRKEPELEYG
jgi:hypothetical protein